MSLVGLFFRGSSLVRDSAMLMRMGPLVQLQDSFLMADVWATESAYDTMVNFSVRDSTGNLLLLWFYFIQLPLMAGHKCSAWR